MALLQWGYNSEDNQNQLNEPSVNPVSSVQSSWQPSGSTANDINQSQDNGNYLLSNEKAQIDEELRKRKAAEEVARQQAEAQAQAQANAARQAAAAQKATTTPKYSGGAKPNEGGFWGFLKDIGSGIQQGVGALGDIAIEGGGVIGSIGKNDQELQQHIANVERVRNWLHSQKDINGNNFVGTQDVDAAAARIASGHGTAEDALAVGGKSLQAGIDATMFVNPARAALSTKAIPTVERSSTMLGRLATNPTIRYAARDAGFFGGLQGAATGAQTYGQTGDIQQSIDNALRDALIGAVLQGSLDVGGKGVGVVANRTLNSLRRGDKLGRDVVDIAKDGTVQVPTEQSPSNAPTATNRADGIPEAQTTPTAQDSNVSFETQLNNSELGGGTGILDNAAADAQLQPPVADGVVQPTPQAPVNDVNIKNVTPVVDAPKVESAPAPVADGNVLPSKVVPANEPNTPVIPVEEAKALKDAKAGANQAEEAQINQKLQELNNNAPSTNSLPDNMSAGSEVVNPTPLTRQQVVKRLMPKLSDNKDIKQRIANAVNMEQDTASPIRQILNEGGVKPKEAERIATHFDTLDKQVQEYNRLEQMNQEAYLKGGTGALSEDVSKARSRVTRDMGTTTRRLAAEIRRLEGSKSKKVALINHMTDLIGTRNANVLTSAGLIERNMAQEISANAKLALKNPVKMVKSTFTNGNILKDTAKAELSHWKDLPRSPLEAVKYVVGNTYRTTMIPTTALANTRRGAVRDELTKWAYKELEGRDLSSKEAHILAGTAGNEMEALVNTFIGVDNGMTNRGQATAALKDWKAYIRTGDEKAKSEFLKRIETHNSLADQMIAGLSKEDAVRARGLMAAKNLIFPFVRTATNLAKTTVKQDLNPFARSLLDEIRVDQRSGGKNAVNLIKSKLVDYGIMGGAAALATSGVLVYNNGDEVDKPKGWSIKVGDSQYIPVRATSLELPIALAGTGEEMVKDIISGDVKDPQYYSGMVVGSLPYIDQFNQTTGAVDSLTKMGDTQQGDGGYAAKSYAINMAKSFVPFSNNGVQPYVAGKQGKSLNAKTVYDKNLGTWFMNALRKNYDPEFYNSLKDSRDNAGRVRTVDNQGVISNKTMNDANTAKYNDTINSLVKYARKAGLGNGTQEVFNTYDTGKNNNFKSVQDSITFLDVPDGSAPDKAKLLEQNGKLAGLAKQIRDGFYGDTGSELLTLDGKNLKSDASVPTKTGSKNSKLPLSMQTIKNAIAQTDLSTADSDKLYQISQAKTDLYNQLKAKSISYDQYVASKSQLESGEISILSNSANYQRLVGLMDTLDKSGFFAAGGLGSTKSGQTYLWNSLNALLGSKGATPAANYPESGKSYTPWGSGKRASNKPGNTGTEGIKWTPVKARQMASVARGKYTPATFKVKLGNAVKKDKTQNYSSRSF